MKKSEIAVGDVLAKSRRKNPERMYDIEKVKVVHIPAKGSTVLVSQTYQTWNGEVKEHHFDVSLAQLVGKWDEVSAQMTLKQKDREIAQLKRQIEYTRVENLLKRLKPMFKSVLDVDGYRLKKDSWRYVLELNEQQLLDLHRILEGVEVARASAVEEVTA